MVEYESEKGHRIYIVDASHSYLHDESCNMKGGFMLAVNKRGQLVNLKTKNIIVGIRGKDEIVKLGERIEKLIALVFCMVLLCGWGMLMSL